MCATASTLSNPSFSDPLRLSLCSGCSRRPLGSSRGIKRIAGAAGQASGGPDGRRRRLRRSGVVTRAARQHDRRRRWRRSVTAPAASRRRIGGEPRWTLLGRVAHSCSPATQTAVRDLCALPTLAVHPLGPIVGAFGAPIRACGSFCRPPEDTASLVNLVRTGRSDVGIQPAREETCDPDVTFGHQQPHLARCHVGTM
jgi:hypothetical protein